MFLARSWYLLELGEFNACFVVIVLWVALSGGRCFARSCCVPTWQLTQQLVLCVRSLLACRATYPRFLPRNPLPVHSRFVSISHQQPRFHRLMLGHFPLHLRPPHTVLVWNENLEFHQYFKRATSRTRDFCCHWSSSRNIDQWVVPKTRLCCATPTQKLVECFIPSRRNKLHVGRLWPASRKSTFFCRCKLLGELWRIMWQQYSPRALAWASGVEVQARRLQEKAPHVVRKEQNKFRTCQWQCSTHLVKNVHWERDRSHYFTQAGMVTDNLSRPMCLAPSFSLRIL